MNRVLLASAGAGKTTRLVCDALAALPKRTAIVTFTVNNAEEIKAKFCELNGIVPKGIEIYTWYTFALQELVRPYQGALFKDRIASVLMMNGTSARFVPKSRVKDYYFNRQRAIYSDKLSDFFLVCDEATGGLVVGRLEDRFERLCVDEVQDFAGYDIDAIERILRSRMEVTLVGDVCQATFKTNHSRKNKGYFGVGFLVKVEAWSKIGLCDIEYMNESYRCIQEICDLADSIFPALRATVSHNAHRTMHDGLFLIRAGDVAAYMAQFAPQVLRYDRKTPSDYVTFNFGEVKGLGYERVLILPYGKMRSWLMTGDLGHIESSAEKVYVAVTRARQSVAFVYDGTCAIPGIAVWVPN